MMSRTAAPSSEVTTPILRGSDGQRPLAPRVEQPLGREPLLELIEGELQRAEPFRLQVLADDLVLALRVVDADAAARDDAQAVLRLEAQVAQRRAEHHALDLRVASFSVKYMCPVFHTRQFDSSPSTQTSTNRSSSSVRIAPVSSETVRTRRAASGIRSGLRGLGFGLGFLEGEIEERGHAPQLALDSYGTVVRRAARFGASAIPSSSCSE